MARIFGFVAAPGAMDARRFDHLADCLERQSGAGRETGSDRWLGEDARWGVAFVDKPNSRFQGEHDHEAGIVAIITGMPYQGPRLLTPAVVIKAQRNGRLDDLMSGLEGSFAIVVIDTRQGSAWIGHDRFGMKPFYYSDAGDLLYFSSYASLVSLARHGARVANTAMLSRFAALHYSQIYGDGETFYDGVAQGQAATILDWRPGNVHTRSYWDFDSDAPFLDEDEDEDRLAATFEELFVASLETRLAPLDNFGFSLSGGMDSTTVLAYYHKLTGIRPQAVSVTYHEDVRANEYSLIKPTADTFLSTWHNVQPTADDFYRAFPDVYTHFDTPWPTATLFAQDRMFHYAGKAGFKTLLGGSGGDHHMAGDYPSFLHYFANLRASGQEELLRHEVGKWIEYHSEAPWIKTPQTVEDFFAKMIDFSEKGRLKPDALVLTPQVDVLAPDGRKALRALPSQPSYKDYLRSYVVREITRAAFPPALGCEDIMGWLYDVGEVGPYWDRKLFEFTWRLPHRMKIRDGITKVLMRRMVTGIVPNHVRLRKAKTGFNLPFEQWIMDPRFAEFARDTFGSQAFRERGLCNPAVAVALLDEHLSGRGSHGMQLWQLLNLELWMRTWITGAETIKGNL